MLSPSYKKIHLPFLKLNVLLISWAGKLLSLMALGDDSAFTLALAPFPHHFTTPGFPGFPNSLMTFALEP